MKRGHVPVRTCLGCRERKPKRELLRLAVTPDGVKVGADGGRGVYICPSASCLDRAMKRKDMRDLVGTGIPDPGQNTLDGACTNSVICCRRSGGGAVG